MIKTNILGFPRIGEKRELKKALDAYWQGLITQDELKEVGHRIRIENWQKQKIAGIDLIPSNDFSFYDQVLDMTFLLGNVPSRFNLDNDLDNLFLMARGSSSKNSSHVAAGEMTKWFDTNYHYIVPEFSPTSKFSLSSSKPFDEFQEALQIGIKTKPVIIGPVTYLSLGKSYKENFNPLSLIDKILKIYDEILTKFENLGVEWIQIDEPIFSLDLTEQQKNILIKSYNYLVQNTKLKIIVTNYFGQLDDNLKTYLSLPVSGLHFDATRGRKELATVLSCFPKNTFLSLGLIDGRNIWKNNYEKSLSLINQVKEKINKNKIFISTSCSLLHSPINLSLENKFPTDIKNWLSFANEKLMEVFHLSKISSADNLNLNKKNDQWVLKLQKKNLDRLNLIKENKLIFTKKKQNLNIHNQIVKDRVKSITSQDLCRPTPFKLRNEKQRQILQLPLYPTTTIGSFPQSAKVRKMRSQFKQNMITIEKYETFLKEEIKKTIEFQEEIGIDVLVHGEFERNDMVEYFGERLNGFIFSQFGWVQSYGSRCVKPPIIYGDISRIKPMTTYWTKYAQSLTKKPVKGMLTGPITILKWSFVRDDQSQEITTKQIALAIRDEIQDLEKIGVSIIQVDEAAIREGLPLKKNERPNYLKWTIECFRLATSGVKDTTQIHTHMCYSDFNNIIKAIADLDADVISIETSRSQMKLLDSFVNFNYPNEIGPGIYDIHSPQIPTKEKMIELIHKASSLIPKDRLWINPDCGLKTRTWEETKRALTLMTSVAKNLR